MSEHSQQLKALASEGIDGLLADLKDIVKARDLPRVKELAQEIADLEIEALGAEGEDKALLREMAATKLGTMAHVLDIERIVVSREIANVVTNGLKTFLQGFSVVAKELIKVAINTATSGIAGAFAGTAGEKLAASALGTLENAGSDLVGKGLEAASEKLDDAAGSV